MYILENNLNILDTWLDERKTRKISSCKASESLIYKTIAKIILFQKMRSVMIEKYPQISFEIT